MFSFKQKTLIA